MYIVSLDECFSTTNTKNKFGVIGEGSDDVSSTLQLLTKKLS